MSANVFKSVVLKLFKELNIEQEDQILFFEIKNLKFIVKVSEAIVE